MGRVLIAAGVVLFLLGVAVSLGARLPVKLGRLPGDFVFRGKNSVFYFPLATSLFLSLLLSLVLWLMRRR